MTESQHEEEWLDLEDSDDNESSEYVTKADLAEAIAEALRNMNPLAGSSDDDDDEGWEILDLDIDVDSDLPLSAADIERIAEKKVQEAMKLLAGKKASSSSRAPEKKAAPKRQPERLPDQPGRKKLSERLWGAE
jgi:hypothetical protein